MTQMFSTFNPSSSKTEMMLPGADMFTKIPTEITLNIFSYLTHRDLARCSVVCREWYYISSDPSLWHHLDLSNLSFPHNTISPTLSRRLALCRSLTLNSPTRVGATDILHLLYYASRSPYLHTLTFTSLTGFRSAAPQLEYFFLSAKTRCLTHVNLSNTAISTPVVQALMKLHHTTLVELKLAFTEIGDGALRAIATGERLESVSIAGCFCLSHGALRMWMRRRVPWSVKKVDLRWLVDVRVGWVGDMLARNALAGNRGGDEEAKEGSLVEVDVSGCERLTLKEMRSIEERWRRVKVSHTAVLIEESVWGYRKYLEYILDNTAATIVSPQPVC